MDHLKKNAAGSFVSGKILSTRTLVAGALLIAMAVILGQFSIMVGPSVRIGFSRIPIIVSGMLLGPVAGGLTGLVHDLVNFVMRPAGGFHPGFTLSALVTGVLPGLVVKFSLSKKSFSPLNIVLSVALVYLIVTLLMNTYWLSQLIGDSYLVLLPVRASTQLLANVANIAVLLLLAKPLEGLKHRFRKNS